MISRIASTVLTPERVDGPPAKPASSSRSLRDSSNFSTTSPGIYAGTVSSGDTPAGASVTGDTFAHEAAAAIAADTKTIFKNFIFIIFFSYQSRCQSANLLFEYMS